MFFSKAKKIRFEGTNPVKLANKFPKVRKLWEKGSAEEKLIVSLSKQLQKSNAIISFDSGATFSAQYIGEVLFFLHSIALRIRQNMPISQQIQGWLEGKLLLNSYPQIEIPAKSVIDHTLELVKKYPNYILEDYLEKLEKFKLKFDECEIVKPDGKDKFSINLNLTEEQKAELQELKKHEF